MQAHDRVPALNGLRGVAIAMVVAYHAAPGRVPGGFVGVSVFFTLSGYLIGSRLVDECSRTGRVDLVRFWAKRARRLLPAALATVLLTIVVASARGDFDHALARSGLAAATYQENWYQLAHSGGYGALFDRGSPLDHYWSLAIEEQFYIVFPLVMVVLFAACRGNRRRIGVALAAAALASMLVPAALGLSFERRYLGADARIGEILVGVVLALIGSSLLARARLAARLAFPCLVMLVVIAFVVPYGSSFFALGFLPVAALSCCVLVGALRAGSGIARMLSARPLAVLGTLSYSLYLVHWPLLTMTDGSASGRITAVAGAIAISAAIHFAIERPGLLIPAGGKTLAAGVALTLFVAAAIVFAGPGSQRDVLAEIQSAADEVGPDGPYVGTAPSASDAAVATSESATTWATTPATTPATSVQPTMPDETAMHASPPPTSPLATSTTSTTSTTIVVPPPRLGFVGDSVALSLGLAIGKYASSDLYRPGPWAVAIGCGLARFPSASGPDCGDPVDRIAALPRDAVDVAVVISCQWELIARKLPGEGHKRDIIDPLFQAYVYSEYVRVADALVANGVDTILWGICAPMSQEVVPRTYPGYFRASRDPERHLAHTDIVLRLAENHPAVEAIDLGRLVEGHVDDPVLRPDGNHFEFDVDVGLSEAFDGLIKCVLPAGCPGQAAATAA